MYDCFSYYTIFLKKISFTFLLVYRTKNQNRLLTLANNIVFYNHKISQNKGRDYRQVIGK